MKNEPTIAIKGGIDAITVYESESGKWVISDHNTGVTTQGDTKYEALLMLADALAAYDDDDIDLKESANEIFTITEEDKEFLRELGHTDEEIERMVD